MRPHAVGFDVTHAVISRESPNIAANCARHAASSVNSQALRPRRAGALDIAGVVVQQQCFARAHAEVGDDIVEQRRVALALAEAITDIEPVEFAIEMIARVQPVEPVDLVAHQRTAGTRVAKSAHQLNHARAQLEARQNVRAQCVAGLDERDTRTEGVPEIGLAATAGDIAAGVNSLTACFHHLHAVEAEAVGERIQALVETFVGDHAAEVKQHRARDVRHGIH